MSDRTSNLDVSVRFIKRLKNMNWKATMSPKLSKYKSKSYQMIYKDISSYYLL